MASAGAGVAVSVGDRMVGSGVAVGVAVKVGRGVAVLGGGEVETPVKRSKLVRRQACKKASKPSQPAPLINFLRFILLGGSQWSVVSSQ